MRFSGERRIERSRQVLWDALHDPDVLARALPDGERFEPAGEATYTATLTLGAAGAHGTYRGRVEEVDAVAPESYRLLVAAAGTPGTVAATARVRLAEEDGVTTLHYEVDATVGGTAGAMGSQLLVSAANRTAEDFLDALERELERDATPTTPASPDAPDDAVPAAPPQRPPRRWIAGAAAGAGAVVVAVVAVRRSSR